MNIIVFILSIVITAHCQQKLFPDIQDLFQTFNEDVFNLADLRRHGAYVKNISIDVEKIDIDKLKSKIRAMNDSDLVDFNDTRRLEWKGRRWQWKMASRFKARIRCLDIMLQIIYMSRHKLRQLESEKFFNPKDTSYRIAFLYRRMRRIWKRLTDIFNTMQRKRDLTLAPFDYLDPFLILHHKAAKKHVDFLYLWWVQVKLHEKYCEAHGIPNVRQ